MDADCIEKGIIAFGETLRTFNENKKKMLESIAKSNTEKTNELIDEAVLISLTLQGECASLKKLMKKRDYPKEYRTIEQIEQATSDHLKKYMQYQSAGFTNAPTE